jgi:threonine aldolase
MKIKLISISAALLLLMSLVPQSANAAKAQKTQKMKRYTVTMQKAHLPVAPNKGTDDYRCFLLDPKVTEELQKSFRFYVWDHLSGQVRWMCSWDTTEQDVDDFISAIKSTLGK